MEENMVQSPAAEAGEWQVDVAEMMQGVTDEAEPAANPAPEPPAPESFTLRHLGETKNVGREEVIALAQKGMDYDCIRSKLGDASRELEALRSGESYDPDPAERRRRDCESFVKAFPEAAEQLRRDGLACHTPRRPALCLRVMRALLEEDAPGRGGLGGELEQSRLLAGLFDGLLEDLLFPDAGGEAAPSLPGQMAAYIEAHYAEPLRMDALSRRFYLSQNQLIRLFHARTGYTPGDYLKKYRLLKACEWLLTTALPVGEVGRRVGYGNASHFTARFREQYGLTPTAYRRLHAAGGAD